MRMLSGWKEIAKHLRQGVRTVQRWELIGLPIHRVRIGPTSPVIAFVEELDAWQQAAPTRTADVVRDLKIKVEKLEAEIHSLKRENRKIRRLLQQALLKKST